MQKIRDILRLRLAGGLSIRQINASTKISLGAIQKLLSRAAELGLNWPLPEELNDAQLARLFYPDADTRSTSRFQVPDRPIPQQTAILRLLWPLACKRSTSLIFLTDNLLAGILLSSLK